MNQVTIIGPQFSSYVRSVALCCEEKGITYTLEDIKLGSPTHLALNPFGKIPVLKHNGLVVYESAAICRYIDRRFDGTSLSPDSVETLAKMDQWISAINCYIDPVLIRRLTLEFAFPSGDDGKPDQAKIAAVLPKVQHVLNLVNNQLSENEYLCDETPNIADYLIIPMLDYASKFLPSRRMIRKLPELMDYLERMRTRPSCQAVLV